MSAITLSSPISFDDCLIWRGVFTGRFGMSHVSVLEAMATKMLAAVGVSVTEWSSFNTMSTNVHRERQTTFDWPLDDVMAFAKAGNPASLHAAFNLDDGLWEAAGPATPGRRCKPVRSAPEA